MIDSVEMLEKRTSTCSKCFEDKLLGNDGKRLSLFNPDGTPADLSWDPQTDWPEFEYEKPEITIGHRRWWDPGYWTNKWYLDPVSRTEIQKGYGLTQNPGW